jgi:hypothetical protein
MRKNGDVLAFGEHIKERLAKATVDLPAGIEYHLVANQPEVVEEAVGEFIKTLIEAIVIVLAVSFLSLGWRPRIVVAIAIPLVLAITFVSMKLLGVSLQRISLGALIIGLGLLVDDAMIAVEMMIKKLEEGCDKVTAATFAYTSTAFPIGCLSLREWTELGKRWEELQERIELLARHILPSQSLPHAWHVGSSFRRNKPGNTVRSGCRFANSVTTGSACPRKGGSFGSSDG